MKANLKIIVDNQAAEGLNAEHGFSIWIEAGGSKILFDSGQGDALEHNAERLGIDLIHADQFVLSHGHYDHTGAVDFVLQESPELQVYAHSNIFKTRYSIYPGKDAKEISMPSEERLIIANLPDSHLHWIKKPTQIAPCVWLTGPIPRVHPLEDTGGPFFDDPEGTIPDRINDDLAMWIETDQGLLVVCGCCHSGLINTLNHIIATSGNSRIWGVVGGLHLKNASDKRLEATAAALREFQPDFIVPCHCTGDAAIDFFKQNLETEIRPGFAGMDISTE
jgi:7,8-dihydropterin-6-yl-methyl-4-(beta-D-ribofuranosyl)aminobenzene 5'-phosphate synthase